MITIGCKHSPKARMTARANRVDLSSDEPIVNKSGNNATSDPMKMPGMIFRRPNKESHAVVNPEGSQTAETLFGKVAKSRLSLAATA